MRRYSVFLWVLLVLSIFLVSNASAYDYGVSQGDQVTFLGGTGPNGGGEFNWEATNEYTFASFCLEKNEYISTGGIYDVRSITDGAISGGIGGPNPDPISDETAWLFWNFSRGTLSGYETDSTQGALQNLIWFFEEEITTYTGTGIEVGWLEDFYTAIAGGWTNDDDKVMVLNLGYYDVNEVWVNSQDQLIAAAPVPEPATMILLGIGLLFIAGVSRKKLKP
ncbi:MAG: PEP-CTERM sorting domain-containing protein [Desulfobacterales bacterium]|nr:PEP-CTERM sorting domain-containing protein [Desulfobacterales bacterium]